MPQHIPHTPATVDADEAPGPDHWTRDDIDALLGAIEPLAQLCEAALPLVVAMANNVKNARPSAAKPTNG